VRRLLLEFLRGYSKRGKRGPGPRPSSYVRSRRRSLGRCVGPHRPFRIGWCRDAHSQRLISSRDRVNTVRSSRAARAWSSDRSSPKRGDRGGEIEAGSPARIHSADHAAAPQQAARPREAAGEETRSRAPRLAQKRASHPAEIGIGLLISVRNRRPRRAQASAVPPAPRSRRTGEVRSQQIAGAKFGGTPVCRTSGIRPKPRRRARTARASRKKLPSGSRKGR